MPWCPLSPTPLPISSAPKKSRFSWTKGASFPLTLTLSLREREPTRRPVEWPLAVLLSKHGQVFSLSLGERVGVRGNGLASQLKTLTQFRCDLLKRHESGQPPKGGTLTGEGFMGCGARLGRGTRLEE